MKKFSVRELNSLFRYKKDSHKGQNGRLLVIGGSELFHAAIFWSADTASRLVDLVHFTSPAMENNDLVRRKVKQGFWQGIVIPWKKVNEYIEEDDCVLIGPGMPRNEGLTKGEEPTASIVNRLVGGHLKKRWVVDGGALQEINPKLLGENMIITPHRGEMLRLIKNSEDRMLISKSNLIEDQKVEDEGLEETAKLISAISNSFSSVTILLKGERDIVCRGDECLSVEGGNAGMTKGGTGDVLAGLVAGFYSLNEAFISAKAGSFINKAAGDRLYKRVGPFYNASDLVSEIPATLKDYLHF
jgi:NAD(P)H-hydrate epimerase